VREKLSCRSCEKITQPAFHAIGRGFAAPSLLAMIPIDKHANHPPLNRQCEQYERDGPLGRLQTPENWCGSMDTLFSRLQRAVG